MSCESRLTTILFFVCTAIFAPVSHAEQVEIQRLSDIVKVLASDEFEGRAPGGPGEEKTVAYLIDSFKSQGLEPGGEDGGWTQAVPLIRTQVQDPASMSFIIGDTHQSLEQVHDIAIETIQPQEQIKIDRAPVVFVGFGASAPERQYR